MGIDWLFEFGALIPSIGVGLLFWFVLRSILRADRLQREAEKEAELEYLANKSKQEAKSSNTES